MQKLPRVNILAYGYRHVRSSVKGSPVRPEPVEGLSPNGSMPRRAGYAYGYRHVRSPVKESPVRPEPVEGLSPNGSIPRRAGYARLQTCPTRPNKYAIAAVQANNSGTWL